MTDVATTQTQEGPQDNDYEQERLTRIQANKRKIEELGLLADEPIISKPKKVDNKSENHSQDWEPPEPARKSERERKQVKTYSDEVYFEDLKNLRPTRVLRTLDEAEIEALRLKNGILIGGELDTVVEDLDPGKKAKRGPLDSGKGVRIQGGKVYDSAHGVTCHWCRQKTLEDNISCSYPGCGKGKRMPTSFCKNCLKNRHGEDYEQAFASGTWVCPGCRGSCGKGCLMCCNCGPCRKKAGLEPTHQVLRSAKDAGFNNVHDYLVHLVTQETPDELRARKLALPWGAFLTGAPAPWAQPAAAAGGEGGEAEGEGGASGSAAAAGVMLALGAAVAAAKAAPAKRPRKKKAAEEVEEAAVDGNGDEEQECGQAVPQGAEAAGPKQHKKKGTAAAAVPEAVVCAPEPVPAPAEAGGKRVGRGQKKAPAEAEAVFEPAPKAAAEASEAVGSKKRKKKSAAAEQAPAALPQPVALAEPAAAAAGSKKRGAAKKSKAAAVPEEVTPTLAPIHVQTAAVVTAAASSPKAAEEVKAAPGKRVRGRQAKQPTTAVAPSIDALAITAGAAVCDELDHKPASVSLSASPEGAQAKTAEGSVDLEGALQEAAPAAALSRKQRMLLKLGLSGGSGTEAAAPASAGTVC